MTFLHVYIRSVLPRQSGSSVRSKAKAKYCMYVATFRKQCFQQLSLTSKHGPRKVFEKQVFVLVQEATHIVCHLRGICIV